uniref:DNA-repair protein Xrcc1 N-terminal domain-containing protein n=1 Tax=Melopsittacus undulatus TaxID=13146 RepID=A0A8V5GQB5_MELUD
GIHGCWCVPGHGNRCGVCMFEGNADFPALGQMWDRLHLTLLQPFRRHGRFGISFIRVPHPWTHSSRCVPIPGPTAPGVCPSLDPQLLVCAPSLNPQLLVCAHPWTHSSRCVPMNPQLLVCAPFLHHPLSHRRAPSPWTVPGAPALPRPCLSCPHCPRTWSPGRVWVGKDPRSRFCSCHGAALLHPIPELLPPRPCSPHAQEPQGGGGGAEAEEAPASGAPHGCCWSRTSTGGPGAVGLGSGSRRRKLSTR